MLDEQREILTIRLTTQVLENINIKVEEPQDAYDIATAVCTSPLLTCIKTSFQLNEQQIDQINDELSNFITELLEKAHKLADVNDNPFSQN